MYSIKDPKHNPNSDKKPSTLADSSPKDPRSDEKVLDNTDSEEQVINGDSQTASYADGENQNEVVNGSSE